MRSRPTSPVGLPATSRPSRQQLAKRKQTRFPIKIERTVTPPIERAGHGWTFVFWPPARYRTSCSVLCRTQTFDDRFLVRGFCRLHFDLRPHDKAAEVARLEGLGARRADVGQGDGVRWVVMTDPDGNEFCVLRPLTPEQLAEG